MPYINDTNLKLAHIDALISLCGFTINTDTSGVRSITTDNGEIVHFASLPGARDYLVRELLIRRTMAQLANIV